MASPLLPVGTYIGTGRGRGGTEAAVTDQRPKNIVHNLQNHKQSTQMTLLVTALRRRPAAGWVAR
jgi:hypothetical protein